MRTKLNRLQVDLEATRQTKVQLEAAYKEAEKERKADRDRLHEEKKHKKQERSKDGMGSLTIRPT